MEVYAACSSFAGLVSSQGSVYWVYAVSVSLSSCEEGVFAQETSFTGSVECCIPLSIAQVFFPEAVLSSWAFG